MRRSLSHQGGPTVSEGDPELRARLVAAMSAPETYPLDDLTHGFHSYPARMHPAIARVLVGQLSNPGDHVLDPFCGSGTVLVEAMAAGRRARGVDLNPLAVRVAEVHCAVVGPGARARFQQTALQLAQASEARVRGRVKVRAPLSPSERAFYSPHVLLELGGLWKEISQVSHRLDRRAFEIVLSSLVVKFSKQQSDTDQRLADKRLRKGLVTEAFHDKAIELVERWQSFADVVPRRTADVRLLEGDVRDLPDLLHASYRARLILCSPPYGGTYDYHDHHIRRYPWLGLSAGRFERGELGARRHMSREAGDAAQRWAEQIVAALGAMAAVVEADGLIVCLVGDGQIGRRRIDALRQLQELGPQVGLRVVASASQRRPDARGDRVRQEHLVALGTDA